LHSAIPTEQNVGHAWHVNSATNSRYAGLNDMSALTHCTCEYGNGYYHTGPQGCHEYNPGKPEAIATAKLESDREPVAKFYGHIGGEHAEAWAYINGVKQIKRFSYVTCSKADAFAQAVDWINSLENQADIFNLQEQ
jgi:hypothetical protein